MENNFSNIMRYLKNIAKHLISKKVLIIILIIIILLVIILPSSYYFITIDDGIWKDDKKGKPSSYTDNVKISATSDASGGLTVDKDAIVKEGLKDLNYTEEEINNLTEEEIIEILDINKKLEKDSEVTSLDDVTQAELLWCLNDVYSQYLDKPEELEKLLNAEIITQYPKMAGDDSKLDGIIQFERHKSDGTTSTLTYIDSETFSKYVQNGDSKVLDYFSLDEQGNALIAVLNTTTETLTTNDAEININEYAQNLDESNKKSDGNYEKVQTMIGNKSINYKDVVQNYTMPFEYLWSLLVVGEDKDFVLELADLVESSQITISIYDNITTVKDVITYKYKKETKTDKFATIRVEKNYGYTDYQTYQNWETTNTDGTEYTVTNTITSENNLPIVDLTKANVWITDYSKEYKYQSGDTTTTQSNSTTLEDTEFVINEETSRDSEADSSLLNDSDAVGYANDVKSRIERYANASTSSSSSNSSGSITGGSSSTTTTSSIEANVSVTYVKVENYERKKERLKESTQTTTVQKYVAQTPVNNLKVDKDSEEDNFVKILCDKDHKKAKELMTSEITSWLFEILEENEDTKEMVDLTKYLLYKATGKDYGITEYDFSTFSDVSFSNVSSSSSELLIKYIHYWEHSSPPPTNADGTKYIIEDDGSGHPTVRIWGRY